MSPPIDWRPGMRALCIKPLKDSGLEAGVLYCVTAVHNSPGVTPDSPPLAYLALSPSVSPEWNSTRFQPITPECDRPRRGSSPLEAHDDFWKDAE